MVLHERRHHCRLKVLLRFLGFGDQQDVLVVHEMQSPASPLVFFPDVVQFASASAAYEKCDKTNMNANRSDGARLGLVRSAVTVYFWKSVLRISTSWNGTSPGVWCNPLFSAPTRRPTEKAKRPSSKRLRTNGSFLSVVLYTTRTRYNHYCYSVRWE